MLGDQVVSDLDLDNLHKVLPLKTTWGQQTFQNRLTDITADSSIIKRRQLPIMSLRIEKEICTSIVEKLETLSYRTVYIDDALNNTDERISESVSQILWAHNHLGAFLNKSPLAMNGIIS